MIVQKGLVFVITSVGSGFLSGIGHVTPRFALPERPDHLKIGLKGCFSTIFH